MSDLENLAADFTAAPDKVLREVRQVVSKGSLNIKNQLKSEAQGSSSFRPLARAMGYDITATADSIESEIGPTPERNAAAGLLMAYWGQSKGGGGTLPDPIHALQAEAPNFTNALENLTGVILE